MDKKILHEMSFDALRSGRVLIETDKGDFEFSQSDCNAYRFENEFARVSVSVFDKGGVTAYRTVGINCKTDLVLYCVSFIIPKPVEMKEFIFYKTFIDAPAAGFLRCGVILLSPVAPA